MEKGHACFLVPLEVGGAQVVGDELVDGEKTSVRANSEWNLFPTGTINNSGACIDVYCTCIILQCVCACTK